MANPYSGTFSAFGTYTFNSNVGTLAGGNGGWYAMNTLYGTGVQGVCNNSNAVLNCLNLANWYFGCSCWYGASGSAQQTVGQTKSSMTHSRPSSFVWFHLANREDSYIASSVGQYTRYYAALGTSTNVYYAVEVGVGSETVDSWTTPYVPTTATIAAELTNDYMLMTVNGTVMAEGYMTYTDGTRTSITNTLFQNYASQTTYYVDNLYVYDWTEDPSGVGPQAMDYTIQRGY